MLDDFCPSSTSRQSRKRFGGSMVAAFVLYGGVSAVLIGATASARHAAEEELTQVEFAPPPPPEPEPPPVVEAKPPPPSPRPKAKRPELAPPEEVPEEKPEESDAELVEAGEGGPVDGFTDGVEGGKGTAPAPPLPPPPPPPPPKPEPIMAAVEITDTGDRPKYPASARRKGIEGTVVVSFEVLENGSVANPVALSGPEELRDAALDFAREWRFKPARQGGKAIRYRMKKSVRFRLEDA